MWMLLQQHLICVWDSLSCIGYMMMTIMIYSSYFIPALSDLASHGKTRMGNSSSSSNNSSTGSSCSTSKIRSTKSATTTPSSTANNEQQQHFITSSNQNTSDGFSKGSNGSMTSTNIVPPTASRDRKSTRLNSSHVD